MRRTTGNSVHVSIPVRSYLSAKEVKMRGKRLTHIPQYGTIPVKASLCFIPRKITPIVPSGVWYSSPSTLEVDCLMSGGALLVSLLAFPPKSTNSLLLSFNCNNFPPNSSRFALLSSRSCRSLSLASCPLRITELCSDG